MTSITSILTSKEKLDHTINTRIYDNLAPNTYTRTVASGKSILGLFRIDSYCTVPLKDAELPVQKVESYEQYISGCSEHERCIGHFCETPGGNILLPQRLASMVGIMSNDYAKAAENVFKNDTRLQGLAYRETIKNLMLKKTGKMRGDMMGGATDSSAREVIASSWVEPNEFCVPRIVAENMKVLKVGRDTETGMLLGHYVEDTLKEGDFIMVVRPPSLWAGNDQPMKVVFWEHECFGPSASNLDEYHGDNDGDEMQIYLVTEPESIKECEKWKQLRPDKFLKAVMENKLPPSITKFITTNPREGYDQYYYQPYAYQELRKTFMASSTLSIRELMDGVKLPETSKAARVKEPMANMFVHSLRNPVETACQFGKESLRGINDVMAQQLYQGSIGTMSRQARIAASCVKYKGHGIFHIMGGTEVIKVLCPPIQHITTDALYPLGGNSCMRGISTICAVAQQAALDSHRVSQEVSSGINLINNLILGGSESLVLMKPGRLPEHSWKYEATEGTYCIVNNERAMSKASSMIGAYNPLILKAVRAIKGDVRTVCRNGISMVCQYYGIVLSELELYSVTELFCYKCEASNIPITANTGLAARNMRWMANIFANHYGKFRNLQYQGKTNRLIHPQTITEAVAFCNFDYL